MALPGIFGLFTSKPGGWLRQNPRYTSGMVTDNILLLLFVVGINLQLSGTTDLTVQISAGTEECFFEQATINKTLTLDYTVIAASQGELDINFQLTDPYNRPMITEFRKSEAGHTIPIAVDGLHRICFDNTFSHFSVKTVAFGISIENEDETHWREYNSKELQPEGVYEVQVEDIKININRVRVHLNRVNRLQEEFRELESRDRSVIENNYERVNFWSGVNLVILVIVGILQVIMVKGLFDEKYAVKRVLRMGRK